MSIFGDFIKANALVCGSCLGIDERYRDYRYPPTFARKCPVCDRLVRYPDAIYRAGACSERCSLALDARRKRDERAQEKRHRGRVPCDVCGSTFTPSRSDARYCSSACRQDAYRRRKEAGV